MNYIYESAETVLEHKKTPISFMKIISLVKLSFLGVIGPQIWPDVINCRIISPYLVNKVPNQQIVDFELQI